MRACDTIASIASVEVSHHCCVGLQITPAHDFITLTQLCVHAFVCVCVCVCVCVVHQGIATTLLDKGALATLVKISEKKDRALPAASQCYLCVQFRPGSLQQSSLTCPSAPPPKKNLFATPVIAPQRPLQHLRRGPASTRTGWWKAQVRVSENSSFFLLETLLVQRFYKPGACHAMHALVALVQMGSWPLLTLRCWLRRKRQSRC